VLVSTGCSVALGQHPAMSRRGMAIIRNCFSLEQKLTHVERARSMGGLRQCMTPWFHVSANLRAIRTRIGRALRALHFDVLREPIPDGMAELVRQLDQPGNDGGPPSTH
jgi:Anti-sigma factor NepR